MNHVAIDDLKVSTDSYACYGVLATNYESTTEPQ